MRGERAKWLAADQDGSSPLDRLARITQDVEDGDQAVSVKQRMALATQFGQLIPVIGPAASSRGDLPGNTLQKNERQRAETARLRLKQLIEGSTEGSSSKFTPEGLDANALFWAGAAEMLDHMCDMAYGPGDCGTTTSSAAGEGAPPAHVERPRPLVELVANATNDPGLRLLIQFQLFLARGLAAATHIWASGLRKHPRPFGAAYAQEGVQLTLDSVFMPAELEAFWQALFDSLIAARALAEHCGWKPGSSILTPLDAKSYYGDAQIRDLAYVLRPELIYVRLLQFVGETGQGERMWTYNRRDGVTSGEHFRTNHLDIISALQDIPSQTLMRPSNGTHPPVIFQLPSHGALHERHLEWLACLLRHTFVAPTQAHRNRAELAFAVSLEIPPQRTRPLPLRAWDLRRTELSWLQWPSARERFTCIIKNTLDRSCRTEGKEGLREPSEFASALAQLVHWSAMAAANAEAEETNAAVQGGAWHSLDGCSVQGDAFDLASSMAGANSDTVALAVATEVAGLRGVASGLVLTTALDLEIETALSRLGPHRVLIPIWLTGESKRRKPVPGWLLGVWLQDSPENPYAPLRPKFWFLIESDQHVQLPIPDSDPRAWRKLSTHDFSRDQGPLVVKLEGSPVHDPSKWKTPLTVESRFPLGESDLFTFLQGALPAQQETLSQKLKWNTLIFIGHDAFQWGDRAQHFGISHAARTGTQPKESYAFTAVSTRPGDGQAYDDWVIAFKDRMGVDLLGLNEPDASSLSSVVEQVIQLVREEPRRDRSRRP